MILPRTVPLGAAALLALVLGVLPGALQAQELGGGPYSWTDRWWAPTGIGLEGWIASSPERPFRIRGTLGAQYGGTTGPGFLCDWFEDRDDCIVESVRTRTTILQADVTAQMVSPPILGVRLGVGAGVGARRVDYLDEGLTSGRRWMAQNADGAIRPAIHWMVHGERRLQRALRLEVAVHRWRMLALECDVDARCLRSGSDLTRFSVGVGYHR